MSRWRFILIAALVLVPVLILALFGSYHLWTTKYGLPVWFAMAGCLGMGYGLGWYWQHKKQLLLPVHSTIPSEWTERDKEAWKLVEDRVQAAATLDKSERFLELDYYLSTGKEMALELARFYHPGAQDPVSSLTLPEILAVVELAAHDLNEMVDRYLPGGHLLTLKDFRRARQATEWYQSASNVYWLVSAIFSPVNTGIRYAASRVGLSTPFRKLQNNVLLWFFTAYVHRLGTYLIDLQSGRLRIGVQRYRDLLARPDPDGAAEVDANPDSVKSITITILGQVKTGKSSFVNALLGEQLAITDVLPATDQVTEYVLHPSNIPNRLVLFDTVGYSHEGARADRLTATREQARVSDLVVLVLHARSPARQADLDLLKDLRVWFASRPDLKMPPVLAVVTHIDLLSPAMEWQPPYDWRRPKRPKEHQIHQALAEVEDQLGEFLAGAVPACTAEGRVFGIEEGFLPALATLLDEVHAVAFLRCLRAEIDKGKVRKVFHQLLQAGKQLVRVAWQNLPR